MSDKNFIGSVFMVAGCAMGAGCLAIPMLSAGPNFIFASLALIFSGILSYAIARVSLEIFLRYKNDANGPTIANASFGKPGVIIFALLNGALMYAILSVYMSGGADLLDKTVFPLLHIYNPPKNTALIIFLVFAVPVFLKGAEVVVKSNKIVFSLKLLCFLVAVVCGLNYISPDIFKIVGGETRYLPKALPIFLTALWFHFLIPVIARLNNYNRHICRKIFAYGISIPVVLYILWAGVMLSLVARDGSGNTFFTLLSHNESVGTMISYATHNNPHLPSVMVAAINLFSNIAMLTSFLTVGISTYDYIRDAFKIKQTKFGVITNLVLTMFPSAFFALFYPSGFVFILQQAAILLMLINIFTLMCCLKEYNHLEYKPAKVTIYCIFAILVGLIVLQVADNFSLLPAFGIN